MNIQRGFTLVELILVMVVIGILAAVVGPRFFSRDVFDERVYFEEALAAVRYAQKVAVASGCPIRVELDSAGYRLLHDAACGGLLPEASAGNPRNVSVVPALKVVFDAHGGTSKQHSTTVGGTFRMTVHETGFVEVTP